MYLCALLIHASHRLHRRKIFRSRSIRVVVAGGRENVYHLDGIGIRRSRIASNIFRNLFLDPTAGILSSCEKYGDNNLRSTIMRSVINNNNFDFK